MDKDFLYSLMDEFEKRNIQELSFKNEHGSIHLLKPINPAVSSNEGPLAAGAAITNAQQTKEPEPNEATSSVRDNETINAPIVGNFYRQPAPDAPYFVHEGDKVSKGQIICILEAMKLMNELKAEFDCEIVKILVENATMVEYDTPLFEIKRL